MKGVNGKHPMRQIWRLRPSTPRDFTPKSGAVTGIRTMVEGRPDWLISRQRAWGVPITIFVHEGNRCEVILERRVQRLVRPDRTHSRTRFAERRAPTPGSRMPASGAFPGAVSYSDQDDYGERSKIFSMCGSIPALRMHFVLEPTG